MLHERTEESILYYKEDVEAVFFKNKKDLIGKIEYYLLNEKKRFSIAQNGYQRAISQHSIDERARSIISLIKKDD